MSCPSCYPFTVAECFDKLVFSLGLSADSLYKWRFSDKHGNAYTGSSTTDEDGLLTIESDQLPTMLINRASGAFQFSLKADGACDPFSFHICGGEDEYDCILITAEQRIVAVTEGEEEEEEVIIEIPCCPEEEEAP